MKQSNAGWACSETMQWCEYHHGVLKRLKQSDAGWLSKSCKSTVRVRELQMPTHLQFDPRHLMPRIIIPHYQRKSLSTI